MTDHITDAAKMVDQLPYTLTEGVTATREGLQFASPLMVTVEYFPYDISDLDEPVTISWNDAAKRPRYRDGEPWCFYHDQTDSGESVIELASHPGCRELFPTLHRLAAILCDDSEAFRILHWCIHNLCNTRTGTNPVEIDGITPDRGHV